MVIKTVLKQIKKQAELLKESAEQIAEELKSPAILEKDTEIDPDIEQFLARR